MLLVAVHPWYIDGAARAGMATGWVNRSNRPYPGYFRDPTYVGATIGDPAAALPRPEHRSRQPADAEPVSPTAPATGSTDTALTCRRH